MPPPPSFALLLPASHRKKHGHGAGGRNESKDQARLIPDIRQPLGNPSGLVMRWPG
jgi:hypothetical protein